MAEGIEITLATVMAAVQENRRLIELLGERLSALLEPVERHPDGFPGKGNHQVHVGTTGLVNPSGTTIGKIFTTVNSSDKWTERVVITGSSLTNYLAQVDMQWLSAFDPNTPAQADAKRDAYIDELQPTPGSMSAEYGYYYYSVPSTESSTPSGWSTKMYRVQVASGTNWGNEGLMFREYSGTSVKDFYLLESVYDSNVTTEDIRLLPITSGQSNYYTDRKTFIETEHSAFSGGFFLKNSYTFTAD